ncbi:MAG: AAA family ATPase [Gammaproteobacteria bacterium]|nr:AAA family ATPase [Gammaproteobacteria bacterium]
MNASNPELELANDFVRHTGQNIFLTGKAGTGKTTFLHQLKKSSPKRMIVTAPTAVAAINAGGVTLHSFFQMPFAPFVPGSEAHSQITQRRFSKEKINIIKSLDLLVIDEISMVRCDLLDGVDTVLRRYRRHDLPFGGVQLLMIGDLHQLSPVARDDDWNMLKQYYDSYYFFSSRALRQTELINIELKQIYRQSDTLFIRLLNSVRNNQMDKNTLEQLNSRYMPAFKPGEGDNYITLSTHNRSADKINETKLLALDSKPFTFKASIENDYPEYAYPTAEKLVLKKGAQVMFVRNDGSAEKLYFNGKIGKIARIDSQTIAVKCAGDEKAIFVEPVTWQNIKYTIDNDTRAITEEVLGEFIQYPLRLAWAITIHKSQGLTFERAIIDANAAFAHGQVYVALSRCKTFEGMVLSTPIAPNAIKTDTIVAQFTEKNSQHEPTPAQLRTAKISYQQKLLLACFDYQALRFNLTKLIRILRENQHLIQFSAFDAINDLEKQAVEEVIRVSEKFARQLNTLFDNDKVPEEEAYLQERVQKASHYFTGKLQQGLAQWAFSLQIETDNKEIRKQVKQALEHLQHTLTIKLAGMESCRERFSPSLYLRALANAEIDFKPSASKQKQTPDYNLSDVEHPELLQTLKAWRAEQAADEAVEQYRILHQRVLIQITVVLPATVAVLKTIKGIGRRTAEKYGARLIEMVSDYCREHSIDPQKKPPTGKKKDSERKESKAKKPESDTKQISYDLYMGGKTIEEITRERGFVRSTIENHLAHFISIGALDVSDFISEEKIAVIKETFSKNEPKDLSEIKHQLGNDFSYGEIRMVKEHLAYEKAK